MNHDPASTRVLLIEDNPGDARLIREMLSEISGFELVHAERLSEGVQQLDDGSFDAVLLDLNLPDSDGMDSLTGIQAAHPDIPIIVLTGVGDPEYAMEFLRRGAQDYLAKGQFDTDALVRAIRYALQRNEYEYQLKQSEELYRLTLNSISDAVFMTKRDGTFTFVCKNFSNAFGWTAEEAMEKGSLRALMGQQAEKCPLPTIDSPVSNYSCTIHDKHGQEKVLLINAQCVNIQGASYLYACRDTTEIEKARKRLAESETKFKTMIDNLNVGVVLMDTHCTILEANRTAQTWFPDMDPQNPLKCQKIYNREEADSPCPGCLVTAAAQDGQRHEDIQIFHLENGRQMTCRIVASPIRDSSGEVRQVIQTLEDITNRIRMEEEIRQSHKMEAVGQLAGGIAHDFNNMLTVIIGGTEFAELNYKRGADITPNLQEIRHAAKRSAELTRQLLAFGRRQHLDRRELSLDKQIQETLQMIRRTIPENVKVSYASRPDLQPVLADPGQINQVLLNLCINARDAMPEGGEIAIDCRPVTLTSKEVLQLEGLVPGNYVLLSVRDNGCGMSPDVLEHIFEPFFTTKGPGKGTGMGLATVYGIIRQHRGTITVKSEVDAGTLFQVYLPASGTGSSTEAVPSSDTLPQKSRGAEQILLVEDDPAVRETGISILRRAGYTVLSASDGTEALSILDREARQTDLAILDVIMPNMGGQQLYRKIRAHWPHICVLFTSGHTDDSLQAEVLNEDQLALLPKPFGPDELLKAVRYILEQKSPKGDS